MGPIVSPPPPALLSHFAAPLPRHFVYHPSPCMSDPVLAFVLVAALLAALTLASWFKNLDASLWRDAHIPLIAGALGGVVVRFVGFAPFPLTIGVVLTLAALYVRLTGHENDPSDGMAAGAMIGAAAAVPLTAAGADDLLRLSSCVLAGAIAGYGITFGLTNVRQPLRQALVDALTAGAAIGGAWAPYLAARSSRVTPAQIAIASTVLVPFLLIVTVFRQWPIIRAELRDEATLGVIDWMDVEPSAHPFRRLGRGGWYNPGAHREFVRAASRIARRKRQQRSRPEEIARLYQLEIIKLRGEMQAMSTIDRRMRAAATVMVPS